MTTPRPAGVIAAIVTPVTSEGRPDHARFLTHARWLLDNGCDGLNVLGTTGEATSFSADDRVALMEAAAEALDPARLMVGTGCPDLPTTRRLTDTAGRLGFAAALVLPPYYYKGVGDAGLEAYVMALVEATDARLYLYNFPQMTGLVFSPELVARLAAAAPTRVLGAKDSSGDLDYAATLAQIDGFDVFPSNEAALAEARAQGFAGCISATANITCGAAQRLWQAPEDTAALTVCRDTRAALSAHPLIPSVKHAVARVHEDPGFARVLPPLMPLSAEGRAAVDALDFAAAQDASPAA
jgi:4-hydroxy-tetrahydrodipicolinate synthase